MNQDPFEKAFGSLHSPTPDELRQALASLSLSMESIAEHIPQPEGLPYGRKVLFATPHVEVILINLPSQQESVPHNHGDSFGWEWIIAGTLTSITYSLSNAEQDEIQQVQTTIVHAGDRCYIAPGEIHSIHNYGELPVISLNVYTPPLQNYKKYEIPSLF